MSQDFLISMYQILRSILLGSNFEVNDRISVLGSKGKLFFTARKLAPLELSKASFGHLSFFQLKKKSRTCRRLSTRFGSEGRCHLFLDSYPLRKIMSYFRSRTVETTTYSCEHDGETETKVEQKVTIQSDGEPIDHDEALAQAIQEATAMNPDMTVEKIEIHQTTQNAAAAANTDSN